MSAERKKTKGEYLREIEDMLARKGELPLMPAAATVIKYLELLHIYEEAGLKLGPKQIPTVVRTYRHVMDEVRSGETFVSAHDILASRDVFPGSRSAKQTQTNEHALATCREGVAHAANFSLMKFGEGIALIPSASGFTTTRDPEAIRVRDEQLLAKQKRAENAVAVQNEVWKSYRHALGSGNGSGNKGNK